MAEPGAQNVEFVDENTHALQNQAFHGERARRIKNGDDWKWLCEYIFSAMKDQATSILMNAKTEEDRMKAQQMFLGASKPEASLEFLISQGDAAKAALQTPTLNPKEDIYA